jgi:hypothetical protein
MIGELNVVINHMQTCFNMVCIIHWRFYRASIALLSRFYRASIALLSRFYRASIALLSRLHLHCGAK